MRHLPPRWRSSRITTAADERERHIVNLVSRGPPNKAVAQRFNLTERTTKVRLHNIYEKLGINDCIGHFRSIRFADGGHRRLGGVCAQKRGKQIVD